VNLSTSFAIFRAVPDDRGGTRLEMVGAPDEDMRAIEAAARAIANAGEAVAVLKLTPVGVYKARVP
jgi:hypothetical protein